MIMPPETLPDVSEQLSNDEEAYHQQDGGKTEALV